MLDVDRVYRAVSEGEAKALWNRPAPACARHPSESKPASPDPTSSPMAMDCIPFATSCGKLS